MVTYDTFSFEQGGWNSHPAFTKRHTVNSVIDFFIYEDKGEDWEAVLILEDEEPRALITNEWNPLIKCYVKSVNRNAEEIKKHIEKLNRSLD